MDRPGRAKPIGDRVAAVEWQTCLALVGCHLFWVLGVFAWGAVGLVAAVPTAIAVAFHSSLQHEALHGHPTRNKLVNEALVFLAVGLAIPYRRFRDQHLTHHNDERLTDPYDDPESFYVTEERWARSGWLMRMLLRINTTFAGRMLVGPPLAMNAFWRSELSLALRGDRRVQGAWVRHFIGMVPVLWLVHAAGVPLWQYVLFAAWPGMSLIMVRSYIEHRAVPETAQRTAVVEAGLFWRLLFLNNNFHAVHHRQPTAPWYRLGTLWQAGRDEVLERNGGYYLRGYGEVVRRWGLRGREPVVDPLGRTGGGTGQRG